LATTFSLEASKLLLSTPPGHLISVLEKQNGEDKLERVNKRLELEDARNELDKHLEIVHDEEK